MLKSNMFIWALVANDKCSPGSHGQYYDSSKSNGWDCSLKKVLINEHHSSVYSCTCVKQFFRGNFVHRGYYMAAQRYEFYFQVVKTIFYERAQ